MIRLRDSGAVDAVRAQYHWTSRHAAVLASGIHLQKGSIMGPVLPVWTARR
jgi:hypothetical protein